jgi:di/tripeptidase
MHYIIRDNAILLQKKSDDEMAKEVNRVLNNYRKLYNLTEQYSDEDVEKMFDKYSFKGILKTNN